MARLPQPGGDSGDWGNILNDFLDQAHNLDGSLKDSVVNSSNIAPASVVGSKIADTTVTENKLSSAVQTKLNNTAPVTSVNTQVGDVTVTKSDIGLSNVDNTTDSNKPISTATQTALDTKADESIAITGSTSLTGGGDLTANRSLTLVNDSAAPGSSRYYGTDGTGVKGFYTIPSSDPNVGGDLTGTASNAQIAAGAIVNADISASAAIVQSKIANLVSDLASKETGITAGTAAQYWRGDKSWQTLDKSAVGLANVDNTSDVNKPISTATQTALNAKVASNRSVATTNSLSGGGDLSADRTLSLVGDTAVPGNSKYYGTDGTGTRGYFSLTAGDPVVGGDLTGTASNAQIASGAVGNAELANSSVDDSKVSASAAIAQSKISNLTGDLAAKVPTSRTITAGTGLSGGGDLSADRTINAVSTTTSSLGIIQLAGDLAGTATSPTVPGLSSKINNSEKGAANGVAQLDGSGKIIPGQLQTVNITKVFPFSYTGNVGILTGPFRLYNDMGGSWAISGVRASVGTAPTGSSLIIDVNKNGTTIFTTQSNRPAISAGNNTSGNITNMNITSVAAGEYLTIDVDQVGSTVTGADLLVQIEVV